MQINSFYNFIEGKRVSLNVSYPENVSFIKYEQLNLWPFGFIILNLPLYKIFNSIKISSLILNIFFISIFFISIYKILNQHSEYLNDKSKAIILLFFAIAIMPSRYMGSTDLWCLGLLFLALFFTLKLIYEHTLSTKKQFIISVLISIIILIMVSLRYTYWIVSFSFPLIMMTYSLFIDRKLLKISFFTSFISTVFAGSYIIFHYNYFGAINPSSLNADKPFDWSALLVYNPLYFNTLYRDSMVRNFFVSIFSTPKGVYIFQTLAQIFSLTIGVSVFSILYISLKQHTKSFTEIFESRLSIFMFSSLIIIVINNITITLAAIKYGYLFFSDLYPLGYTTVAEVRYFAPTLILFFIYLILAFHQTKNSKLKWVFKFTILSGFGFAIIINICLVMARIDRPIIAIPKHLHTYDYNTNMYEILAKKNENRVYLPSPYSDLKDYYMATYAHIPELKNTDWKKLNLNTTKNINIVTLVNQSDTILSKYNPQILVKSLKPSIDLVEFTLKPTKKN